MCAKSCSLLRLHLTRQFLARPRSASPPPSRPADASSCSGGTVGVRSLTMTMLGTRQAPKWFRFGGANPTTADNRRCCAISPIRLSSILEARIECCAEFLAVSCAVCRPFGHDFAHLPPHSSWPSFEDCPPALFHWWWWLCLILKTILTSGVHQRRRCRLVECVGLPWRIVERQPV
jgi:hypothetical protein